MMSDSVEDLSARARRGELDEAGRRRLALLLEASLEARLCHRAGQELDAEDWVMPGDEERSERVIRRLTSVLDRRRHPRRARGARAWAAAALLCGGVAAAGTAGLQASRSGDAAPVASPTPNEDSTRARAPAGAPMRVETERTVSVPSASTPEAASRSSLPAMPASTRAAPGVERESPGPAELFAQAAKARREGDVPRAIALYDSLQSTHPASAEARAADTAIGALRLPSSPSAALDHFQRYLRRSPTGELAPEALWGQARALERLGRHAEARNVYGELVRRYPDSTYARSARARLAPR
jgi:TolA-binding protein